jgi:hypothetical protein
MNKNTATTTANAPTDNATYPARKPGRIDLLALMHPTSTTIMQKAPNNSVMPFVLNCLL